jgi:hypothetical protein
VATDQGPAPPAVASTPKPSSLATDEGPASRAPAARAPGGGRFVAGLTVAVGVVPFVTALVVLRRPRWFPEMDLAMTELLVRDVGTPDAPLIGLVGRIFGLDRRGHHPGPLSFWLLAPVYRLFGSTAWALQVSAAALNVVAIGTAVWIGHRRGGRVAATGIACLVGILALEYGTTSLTQPWNPYIPRLWWVVFLLAAWSVLCGDLVLLPVAVFAGALCVQTHISYVGTVAGVASLVVAALAVARVRRRDDPVAARRIGRWAAWSFALLILLWVPPLVQQFGRSPGNLSVIVDSIVDPVSDPVGMDGGTVATWLAYLDVPALLGYGADEQVFVRDGPIAPGLVLLAAWVVAAVWTARRRLGRDLLALHAVVGAALAAGLVSMSRIQGEPLFWVALWAWGTTLMVVLAVGWTVAASVRRLPSPPWAITATGGRAVLAAPLAAGLVAVTAALTFQAAHTGVDHPDVSHAIGRLAPTAAASLEAYDPTGAGGEPRYVLRWNPNLVAEGLPYGILLELERRGLDVGAISLAGIPYRSRMPEPGTWVVDYVVGDAEIERWRALPGATEVAYDGDPELGPIAIFVSDGTPEA